MSAVGNCHFQLSSLLTECHLTPCKILHRFHPLTLHLLAREAHITISLFTQWPNEKWEVCAVSNICGFGFVLYKTHSVCVLITVLSEKQPKTPMHIELKWLPQILLLQSGIPLMLLQFSNEIISFPIFS